MSVAPTWQVEEHEEEWDSVTKLHQDMCDAVNNLVCHRHPSLHPFFLCVGVQNAVRFDVFATGCQCRFAIECCSACVLSQSTQLYCKLSNNELHMTGGLAPP